MLPSTSYRATRPSAPTDASSTDSPSAEDANAKPTQGVSSACVRCLPTKSKARAGSAPFSGSCTGPSRRNSDTPPALSAAAAYAHAGSSLQHTRVTASGVNRIDCVSANVCGSSAFSSPPRVPTTTPKPSLLYAAHVGFEPGLAPPRVRSTNRTTARVT